MLKVPVIQKDESLLYIGGIMKTKLTELLGIQYPIIQQLPLPTLELLVLSLPVVVTQNGFAKKSVNVNL